MTAPDDLDDDGMESPVVLVHCDGCGASDRTTNPAAWQASHEQCASGRLFEATKVVDLMAALEESLARAKAEAKRRAS